MAACVQGNEPCSRCERSTVSKSHVRMMSWLCGRRSIGKTRANRIRIAKPVSSNLRRERRCGPRIHDVGIAGEAIRLVPLTGGIAVRRVGGGIDRQLRFLGQDRVARNRPGRRRRWGYHTGNGTPKKSLPADAPVTGETVDPVLVAVPHVFGMPLQLRAARQQFLPELHRLDEPLPAGHDLEGTIALLVELHRMRDRPRFPEQIA